MKPGFFSRALGSLLLLALALNCGCNRSREVRLSGETMGTTYHIRVVAGASYAVETLRERVAWRLEQINRSMSTFRADSEISRFNALAQGAKPLKVSEDFWQVLEAAHRVYRLTGGAWDGTVYPLIELWGFTKALPPTRVPPRDRIRAALSRVGFDHIRLLPGRRLAKQDPRVELDLASIAKGYGVDRIASLMRAEGLSDFLVEIGGEVLASGRRRDGRPWQVGISRPEAGDDPNDLYRVLSLTDRALATSGDYRNFFEIDGRHYSHVMDPRTGYPVDNHVVSVSVVAPTCTLADGLATGIMVMGPQKGIALVNGLDGVECLIVVRKPGGLTDFYSKNFRQFLN
jgi:thiamine biosynthesis lipoprotein